MMSKIETQAMDAVIGIHREMRKANAIDWEQRRYEIAKESLVAIMSNDEFYAQVLYEGAQLDGRRGIPCNISRAAVVFADALIVELKGGHHETEESLQSR